MAYSAIVKAGYYKAYEKAKKAGDKAAMAKFAKKKESPFVNKVYVIGVTFIAMSAFYIYDHSMIEWLDHFFKLEEAKGVIDAVINGDIIDHAKELGEVLTHGGEVEHTAHRKIDLIYEMVQLFLMFEVVEVIFTKSGMNNVLGRSIKSTGQLMWTVFTLSAFMDNILMALVGAAIVVTVWKKMENVPIKIFIAIIVAANLGGAFSVIGDTTTIIISLLKGNEASPQEIASAIWGSASAFLFWVWYVKKDPTCVYPPSKRGPIYLVKPLLWVIGLGILGILIGTIKFHQPGIGLFIGATLGFIKSKAWRYLRLKEVVYHIHNGSQAAMFIAFILMSAEMLDLSYLKPLLAMISVDAQAYVLGNLSGILDNIPLTSMACNLGGFDWPLLAYCVGFGGSMFFFSSSAGIAVGMSYWPVSDSKAWLPHTVRVIIAFNIGFFTQIFYRDVLSQAFVSGAPWYLPVLAIGGIGIAYLILGYNLKLIYAPGLGILRQKIKDIQEVKEDLVIINNYQEFLEHEESLDFDGDHEH